ncbi:sulfatase-like hydrolase/transferase [Schlesneria sp. T3-172]|uniref:sulfatase-like hydrolase/transferase n=1 Tax=Schlesneria sphaerica TaxID=3373610 RepID=UPI0037C9F86F
MKAIVVQPQRRIPLWITLIGVALAVAIGWSVFFLEPRQPWNVIVITLDTTRADHLGCYGAEDVHTPMIDELASRGVLFERAYAPAPLTLTSHSTMFTGLHPPEHGLITNGKGRLPDEIETFAEVLSRAGYATGAFVASFVLDSRFGLNQGFETYDDDLSGTVRPHDVLHRERSGSVVVDSALKWLASHKQEKFHCWIHLYDPHFPYQPHEVLFGDKFQERLYDGEIGFVDRQIARITKFLREEKLTDNTCIVIVGDHGEGLNEHQEPTHGYLLYRSTLHVPLIIVPPPSSPFPTAPPPPVRVTQPVPLVDLMPTMLDLLRLPIPKPLSGQSLAGLWRGEPVSPRDCFSMTDEPFLDNGWAPLRSLTTSEWKYIRSPKAELYRISDDPDELTNLAESQPDIVNDLEQRLMAIEDRLRIREVNPAELSAKERKTLASLGYTGGLSGRTSHGPPSEIDVKDMLPLYNQLSEAIELLEHGDLKAAETSLRQIVETNPRYLKAMGNLGICLAQQQKWDEAIECYQNVLKIDPDDFSALMNLAAADAVHGRIDEAISNYHRAQTADPKSPAPPFHLAQLAVENGGWPQALELFAKAVKLDPEFDEAHRAWGDLLVELGDHDGAAKHYDAALAINPESLTAIVNRGILDARRGETEAAEQQFRRALELAPDNLLCRRNLGLIHQQRGRMADAINEFEQSLKLAPDHIPTLLSLGWIRASHPDSQWRNAAEGLKLAEQACAGSQRQSADSLDLLAAAYAESERFDEAVSAATEALEKIPPQQPSLGDELKRRRELYRQKKPYRQPAP